MRTWFGFIGGVVSSCLILGVAAPPAVAQLVNEEGVGRLTVGLGIGLLLPEMGDVNENIDVVNPFLAREEIRSLDRVSEGLLTHLDVRYRLGTSPKEDPAEGIGLLDRITVGFAWGAMNARSEFAVSRAIVRFFSRTTTYYPYALYHLPFLDKAVPRAQLVVGGGPLFLRNGDVEWFLRDDTTNNFFVDIEDGVGDLSELSGRGEAKGDGLGGIVQGGGTFMLNQTFSVGVDLGYRFAKISNLDLTQALGQADLRFPPGTPEEDVRRPGDWAVIDFFFRDPGTTYEGRDRTDAEDKQDPEAGGCSGCPLYYQGGPLEVDYSGPFATITFRSHF